MEISFQRCLLTPYFHPWKFHSRGYHQVLPVWICAFFFQTASQQCPFFCWLLFFTDKKITAEVYIKSCTEVFVSQIHQNNMFKTNLQVYQLYFWFLIFFAIYFVKTVWHFFVVFFGEIWAVSGPYQGRIRAVSEPYQGQKLKMFLFFLGCFFLCFQLFSLLFSFTSFLLTCCEGNKKRKNMPLPNTKQIWALQKCPSIMEFVQTHVLC